MVELKGAVDAVVSAPTRVEPDCNAGNQLEDAAPEDCGSYAADRVKSGIPVIHAAAVAKAELQKRKIRLVKATGMEGVGLSELTEKELVEKANIALAMMENVGEVMPDGIRFAGAFKEREAGGVTFELNSSEAGVWLKDINAQNKYHTVV